jgi:hypothetical protein
MYDTVVPAHRSNGCSAMFLRAKYLPVTFSKKTGRLSRKDGQLP